MNWTEQDWARLGSRIRTEREGHGLSRRALSEAADVSEKSIQVAEEGRAPRARWPQSLKLIEKALGWESGHMKAILAEGSDWQPGVQLGAIAALGVNERFGAWLKKERESAGFSQAALAERLYEFGRPIYQQTIAKIELGERGIELDLAVAIAAVFGATPDAALGLAVDGRSDEEIHLRGMLARRERFIRSLVTLTSCELQSDTP